MGRDGAKKALAVAGLAWAVVGEVYFGIGAVIEKNCTIGDWSLSSCVVVAVAVAEGLIACAAAGRRGAGLPVSTYMISCDT